MEKQKKTQRIEIRLTEEQMQHILLCAEKLNVSKTEVIESGIDNMYSLLFHDGNKYLYPNVYHAILRNGYNIKAAANALNIPEKSLDNLLTGKTKIRLSQMREIRDLFAPEQTFDELFCPIKKN